MQVKRHQPSVPGVPTAMRHHTAPSASRRNTCVAALAYRILILHAAQGSKTEALCQQQAIAAAKPVYTLPSLQTTLPPS